MRNRAIAALMIVVTILKPSPARADLFGGDVVVLGQILVQAIQQLAQLKQILSTGKDNLNLIRDLNRGIHDSLNLFRTASPHSDPGLYREWQRAGEALRAIEAIYGVIVPSQDAKVQHDADQSVAEAVALNNSIYSYTRDIDEIGEEIKSYSHSVSPGGAQKLTAQSLGVILHVMNQTLRAQATGLKLQAQTLAIQNHKDKEMTRHIVDSSKTLTTAMKAQAPTFEMPRF